MATATLVAGVTVETDLAGARTVPTESMFCNLAQNVQYQISDWKEQTVTSVCGPY